MEIYLQFPPSLKGDVVRHPLRGDGTGVRGVKVGQHKVPIHWTHPLLHTLKEEDTKKEIEEEDGTTLIMVAFIRLQHQL